MGRTPAAVIHRARRDFQLVRLHAILARVNRLQDLIEQYVGEMSVSHLLDLGCGDGAATRRLLYAGVRPQKVTGVDPVEDHFSPSIPEPPSPDHVAAPGSWSFLRDDAHAVLSSELTSGDHPDMIVLGRMLHHVPRYGNVLAGASSLLRETVRSGKAPAWLLLWEPVAADGPFSALHEMKTDVDRELGIPHRRPFPRKVLERVIGRSIGNAGVIRHVTDIVQASREAYTEEEYLGECATIREYIKHARGRPDLYATLSHRLSRVPTTSAAQPFGEPVLLVVAEFR